MKPMIRFRKEIGRVPYKVVRGDNNTPRVDIEDAFILLRKISANGTSEDEEKQLKTI